MPTLEAPIVAVTVFVNRARVIRRGKITLEAGEYTLILDTLPAALEADSVRASGSGAGVMLLGVDVKTEYVTHAPQQAIADMETQLAGLNAELQALTDDVDTLNARMAFLDLFGKNSSRKLAQTLGTLGGSLTSVTELSTYLVQQMSEVQAALRNNAQQQRELKKQIAAVQLKLGNMQVYNQHKIRQIHVAVRVEASVEFELEIAYAVIGAAWQPLYDVRLREDGEVELTYLANVLQLTGEDWNNVEMALSTARPAINMQLPELQTLYIYDARHIRTSRMEYQSRAPQDTGELKLDDLRLADGISDEQSIGAVYDGGGPLQQEFSRQVPPKPQAHVAQTTIVEAKSGASVTYKIGTPVKVPSDGTPHKTTVAITNLSAKLDYLAAPKIAAEAYLRATITNTSAYTLLPGEASIFHEDEFVGKTKIYLTAPNEEFEVQLGVDDRIKIERELVNREASKRFIGSAQRIAYTYRITVTNLLPTSAKINVLDQYPIPREESIKIQHDKVQPAPTEQTDLGVLTWTFDLAPNAKQEISLAFTVEHPRDAVITGLGE
jgi:uncharacterized protein (TIGR02231 family)